MRNGFAAIVCAAVLIAVGAWALQSIPSDFDDNGRVDFNDFLLFAQAFGSRAGDPGYDGRFDLDGSSAVDFGDFLGFATAFGASNSVPPEPEEFAVTGLGGGGAMYSPAASPHDPNLMFVSCDMSGFYRSTNGGNSWTMLPADQIRSAISCRPIFHPVDPTIVYAYGNSELKVSENRGRTWRTLAVSEPWGGDDIVELGIDTTAPERMFAGTSSAAYVSLDGGATWSAAGGVTGSVLGFHADSSRPATSPVWYVGTSDGVWKSTNSGTTWQDVSSGLPWKGLRGFAGSTNAEFEQTAIYVTVPSQNQGGQFAGGVFWTLDGGATWTQAMGEGINTRLGLVDQYGDGEIAEYYLLATADNHPETVYVTNRGTGYWPPDHFTVHRTDDFGATWEAVYHGDPRFPNHNLENGWLVHQMNWGWGGHHTGRGFNVNRGNVDQAMYTNNGEINITSNGGDSWFGGYSRLADGQAEPGKGKRWESVGLEVTSVWNTVFDLHDPERMYLAYTDIGFARSQDGGASWEHSVNGAPWTNTLYDVKPDPDLPGVIYAAASNQHDIPHWTNIETIRETGGVLKSTDHGATWTSISNGLPESPATSLALDPSSPSGARIMWVALMNKGVYKTTDGGANWAKSSNGLGLAGNQHTWMVKRTADGTLYCSITGKRSGSSFSVPGGLYRSTDGGASWSLTHPGLSLHWAGGFDIHPDQPNTIFLAAATAPQKPEGGLYRTADGGATWTQVVRDGDLVGEPSWIQAFFVTIDPNNPDRIYFSTTAHGLWLSEDGGDTWSKFNGIPFNAVQQVTIDPRNPEKIWVSTFGGGVWHGPAKGVQ